MKRFMIIVDNHYLQTVEAESRPLAVEEVLNKDVAELAGEIEILEVDVPIIINVDDSVLQKKRTDYCYVGRGSKWGNPYPITRHSTREQAITEYERTLRQFPDLLESLYELNGKVLGCHCKPLPCHGDVLVNLFKQKFCDPALNNMDSNNP